MGRRGSRRGPGVREELRKKAEELAVERAKRSPKEQLAVLDERLGDGVGASRERSKLTKVIEDTIEKAARSRKTERSKPSGEGTGPESTSKAKDRRRSERSRARKGDRRG